MPEHFLLTIRHRGPTELRGVFNVPFTSASQCSHVNCIITPSDILKIYFRHRYLPKSLQCYNYRTLIASLITGLLHAHAVQDCGFLPTFGQRYESRIVPILYNVLFLLLPPSFPGLLTNYGTDLISNSFQAHPLPSLPPSPPPFTNCSCFGPSIKESSCALNIHPFFTQHMCYVEVGGVEAGSPGFIPGILR